MPFYVPFDYPQPWLEMSAVTSLVGGVALASVAGAATYMWKKQ